MTITNATKKHFRNIGHNLKPIVTIAERGLTESVITEIERALEDHELIKIKLAITDRESRKETIQALCQSCKAETIQEIGKVALIFRQAKEPSLKKSNIR